MRIVHLPLDSRPCNLLFPGQLAAWCGHECIVPSAMDFFTAPASFEDSRDFLLHETEHADALVVSAEHLCFGSLLESRNDRIPEQEALQRLEVLREIRTRRPEMPVHVYSVLMRSSVSALAAGDLKLHRAMTDYSFYTDRASQTGSQEDARRARQAFEQLPPEVVSRYRQARRRNHAVNMRCAEMTEAGVFDSLLLLQEDSEPYGFHKTEQRVLAQKYGLLPRLWMHNGTDEGGALAVMKTIVQKHPLPPVAVRFLGWKDGAFIARYEDRPFGENVWDSLDYAGLQTSDNAPDVLAVCCPPDGVQTDWPTPAHAEGLEKEADEIVQLAQEGRNVYVLDVTRANGGAPALMQAVFRRAPDLPLAGYSAWNTASNSLGTAIAQMMSDRAAGTINRAFLWERLLDDLAYQGVVRGELNDELEAAGEDLLHLKNPQDAERRLREKMESYLAKEPMFAHAPGCMVSLPWGRTFEAEVRVK